MEHDVMIHVPVENNQEKGASGFLSDVTGAADT